MSHVKDSSYFSHDSNARRDPKILALRSVYGMEGYGWYWAIIETLREQPDFRLKLDAKYAFKAIAMELQCEDEVAKQFVEDCIKEFTLFESDGVYFWSNSLLRRMAIKEAKSSKARQAANVRWGKAEESDCTANAMRPQSENPPSNASKGKESKGKESKDNISTRESNYMIPKQTCVSDEYTDEFEQFWQVYPKSRRKEKKAAYRAWKARLKAGAKPEQLITAATLYAQECKGKDPRYIKLPKTFLGPDCPWEEYQTKYSWEREFIDSTIGNEGEDDP